jgi:hypothetical protein
MFCSRRHLLPAPMVVDPDAVEVATVWPAP